MIEDKLSQDERLRLECLAQAIQCSVIYRDGRPPKYVTDTAKIFEEYVRTGNNG